jgi:hypothetical protein
MDLKAEQCWKRAACYEKIAEDEGAPIQIRMRFVLQANLLRIMARLAELDEANASANKTCA